MILKTTRQSNYELIDSGDGMKLERFGDYTMVRPDPEALWKKSQDADIWESRNLEFIREGQKGKWIIEHEIPNNWTMQFGDLTFSIKPTSFKHVGLFPEQLPNWEWMKNIIEEKKSDYNRPISVLNLFAYTGGASLACAKAGAEVCHVDASKSAVEWARENAELSGLSNKPIRWIIDDVIMYLKREVKRGRKYDAIVMDPPSFGHGPKDELWKIEEHFLELMDLCKQVLSDNPLFVLINGYTAGYSPIAYKNNLEDMLEGHTGEIETGELAIEESASKRLLPAGIFARWSSK